VREALNEVEPEMLLEQPRQVLWEALRKTVAWHLEYSDAKWAFAAEEVDGLDALANRLASVRPETRHGWLFDARWVELGDLRRRDDHQAYEHELARRRGEAIGEVYAAGGLEGVLEFARAHQAPLVGSGFADATGEDHLDTVVGWLDGDETQRQVANAYVWYLCRPRGLPWALALLDRHDQLSLAAQAGVLLCVRDFLSAADAARTRHTDVEMEFWKAFSYVGRGGDFKHVVFVATQLMMVGRWAGALDMLALYMRDDAVDEEYAEAIASAFEGLIDAKGEDREIRALATWDFERLFRYLDQHVDAVGIDRITRIQWYFLSALGFDPPTNSLHRSLAENPAFFNEMICLNYRARTRDVATDEAGERDEQREAQARNAHMLLNSWRLPPGTSVSGDFDIERCELWIHDALDMLEASDRLEIGKQHIGWVLAHTPHGPEGWPSDGVARLIGKLDDDEIDTGMKIRIQNKRGATTRGLTAGGDQERSLAAAYREAAGRFVATEPRVAALLNSLAEIYEDEARHHDAEAERRRRGLHS
jgi:hypothetical protein